MIYNELLTLFAHTVVPLNVSRTLVLVIVAILLVSAQAVAWQLSHDDPARSQLTRWIWIVLAGLVMAAVAGTIYAPAVPYYSPLELGIGNRVNALPAVGLVIAAYGIYMIVGTLTVCCIARMRMPRATAANLWLASVVALALAVSTGIRFTHLVRIDVNAYDLASRYQLIILDTMHAHMPQLSQGETLFTFGAPAYTAPGVPAFAAPWDLNGAVQVSYHDPTLSAYPVIPGSTLTCTARGIVPTIEQGPPNLLALYGHVILFDDIDGQMSIPHTRAQCLIALPQFAPGLLSILPPPSV
jgi:hypothetical protein